MSSLASVPAISYGESTAMVAGNEAAAAGLAALARKSVVALLDSELPPLPTWSTAISFLDVAEVAEVAEVAVVTQELSRRRAIAFDVARHWRRDGYLFSFLAFDGSSTPLTATCHGSPANWIARERLSWWRFTRIGPSISTNRGQSCRMADRRGFAHHCAYAKRSSPLPWSPGCRLSRRQTGGGS